jgi:hypothetical protein
MVLRPMCLVRKGDGGDSDDAGGDSSSDKDSTKE